jgi:tetratricopeptide (TPR) repeat protein
MPSQSGYKGAIEMETEEKTPENETTQGQAASNLCKVCGHGLIDRSESAHSVLCTTCRETMIRHPIPKIFILFSILIVILVAVASNDFPKVLNYYRIYEHAQAQADSGEISIALSDLNTVMEKYPDSNPIAIRMADIAMEKGYYEVAGYVIDTYLSGDKMDDVIVSRMNGYVVRINKYVDTANTVSEFESALDPALPPEEATKQYYDFVKNLMDQPGQDKALLYYYLSMVCDSMDEMKSCLENCLKEDQTFLVAKVQLGNLMRRQGDSAAAEQYYNEVFEEDNYNSGAMRGLAILHLLDGNTEEGLNLARQAFETNPEELYAWETYIIALHESKNDDEADAQLKEYLAKGNQLQEDTQNYLDGKLSLQNFYIGE